MFGHRPDGKLVKSKNGLYLLIPHIMDKRVDSMNMAEFNVELDYLDQFIKQQKEETGIVYSYLEVLIAAIVRTIYLRPELNRFVVNKRIYERDFVYYSMAIQKSLKSGVSNETTLKFKLEGNESISSIKNIFEENVKQAKSQVNDVDKLTTTLAAIPHFILKFVINMLKLLDRWGILPMSVIDAQPFHTTFFITDLRSVKCESIFHHVYEFGTTGLFFSTGPEKLEPYYDKDGNIAYKRVMPVKFVSDERFCDGFYFATSLRMLQKILRNPKVLLNDLELRKRTPEEQKRHDKLIARDDKRRAKMDAKLARDQEKLQKRRDKMAEKATKSEVE